MYEAYSKLKHAGITVYSVKIDAFTIKAEDEQNFQNYGFLCVRLEAGERATRGYQLPNELFITKL